MECKAILIKTVTKLQEKSPLKYSMVRNLNCLDPGVMVSKPVVAKSNFSKAYWLLVKTGKAKESNDDAVVKENI